MEVMHQLVWWKTTYSRPVIYQGFFPDFRIFYKSSFAPELSWKKRSSHQGKKEVACIVFKPLVSCLWWCGESVNPPELNIQEVQGVLSSRPKGDPGLLPTFHDFILLSNHTPDILIVLTFARRLFIFEVFTVTQAWFERFIQNVTHIWIKTCLLSCFFIEG